MLYPPSTGTSFIWNTADIAAGTTVIFTMTDAKGNSGGSSDIEMVTQSNIASCLNSNSPSSTVAAIPSSTTAGASQTSSHTQIASSGVSLGTIIGAAVGTVAAIAAIVALAICYLKRQRYGRSPYGLASTRNSRRPNSVELDPGMDNNFHHPPIYPFPYQNDSVSRLAPPIVPGSSAIPASYQETYLTSPSVSAAEAPYTFQQHSRTNSNTDSFAALGDVASSSMTSSGRRKAAMAGIPSYQPTTRFIVHTDADDRPAEGEPEVVELPPQYSERRAPLVNHTEVSSTDLAYLGGQHAGDPPRPTSHPPPPR